MSFIYLKHVLPDKIETREGLDVELKKVKKTLTKLNDQELGELYTGSLTLSDLFGQKFTYELFLSLNHHDQLSFIILYASFQLKVEELFGAKCFNIKFTNESELGKPTLRPIIDASSLNSEGIHVTIQELLESAISFIVSKLGELDFNNFTFEDRAYLVKRSSAFRCIINMLHGLNWTMELVKKFLERLISKIVNQTTKKYIEVFAKNIYAFLEESSIDKRVGWFLERFSGLESEFPFDKNGLFKSKVFDAAVKFHYNIDLEKLLKVKSKRSNTGIIEYCSLKIEKYAVQIKSSKYAESLYEGAIDALTSDIDFWQNAKLLACLKAKELYQDTISELSFQDKNDLFLQILLLKSC